jgi:hypothetical protein
MSWEPAVGDLVEVTQPDSSCFGDVGEIEGVLYNGIRVRIVQEESPWRGQVVYFNAGQLSPVKLGR